MKYFYLFVFVFLTSACVTITPGGDSSSSTKLMMEFLKQQKKTESPAVVSVDSTTLLSMSPEQIKALSELASVGKDAAINAPKNVDESNSTTGMDSTTKTSQTESMLWKGLGACLLALAAILFMFVWKWFSGTPLGQLLSKSGAAGVALAGNAFDYLEEELKEVMDKQRDTHDASELAKLKERENQLRRKKAEK